MYRSNSLPPWLMLTLLMLADESWCWLTNIFRGWKQLEEFLYSDKQNTYFQAFSLPPSFLSYHPPSLLPSPLLSFLPSFLLSVHLPFISSFLPPALLVNQHVTVPLVLCSCRSHFGEFGFDDCNIGSDLLPVWNLQVDDKVSPHKLSVLLLGNNKHQADGSGGLLMGCSWRFAAWAICQKRENNNNNNSATARRGKAALCVFPMWLTPNK